jgi:D-beta-D-heptose 7-phosphate kinase/D-beta-D-heptose 1-phosphate adenosyltransferase
MPSARHPAAKITSLDRLSGIVRRAKSRGRTVALANGCFDVLHPGHVELLTRAKQAGDLLVVAVNSDRSVRGLGKGSGRPILRERDRAVMLGALECVDYVVLFNDATPHRVIERLKPDVLVKGADWSGRAIVGREIVERAGGRVLRVPLRKGYSTSQLLARIRATGS